jgi:HEAT repeat protein
MDFQFEPRNFLLGLLGGWATAFAVYQARGILGAVRQSVSERRETAQRYATRSAEGRYVGELQKLCQSSHLAGASLPLTEIVVEPRFIAPAPFAAPPDEEANRDPFNIIPHVHDFPALHSGYNLQTLSIEDLGRGERALALLGLPGSGRTTALQTIALWSLSQVDFRPPKDAIQLQLEAEEASLKADERAERIKARVALAERARERLAEEQGQEVAQVRDPGLQDSRRSDVPLLKRLLPIYIDLGYVLPELEALGRRADPAEPLVRAVQMQYGGVTAKVIPRKLYEFLNRGAALVLIDGFDDLSVFDRQRISVWLRAFVSEYRRNFIIVSGPASGYDTLSRTGLTPIFMRPWNDVLSDNAANLWADRWLKIANQRREGRPADSVVAQAKAQIRGLSAFDAMTVLRGIYAGDLAINDEAGEDNEDEIRVSLSEALRMHLKGLGLSDEVIAQAANAASIQMEEGLFDEERLQKVALARAGTDVNADTKAASRLNQAQSQLIKTLENARLIQRYQDGRWRFRHSRIAAYLASLTLQTADVVTLRDKGRRPEWLWAFAYAAGHMAIEPAVQARLEQPPDVMYDSVLSMAHWLATNPDDASWRNTVLKQFDNLLNLPNQFSALRERAAAALVTSRDPAAVNIFRRALRSADADIRLLGCLGLGATRDPLGVEPLRLALNDTDSRVQLAATLANGPIATDESMEQLAVILTQRSEALQRAAAETFAALPTEGYPVLYEAVTGEDLGMRRAAVWGLGRVPAPWAIISIYRVFLEDPQWYVRSAAQQVFIDMQENDIMLRAYPTAGKINWLRDWVETQGEDVGVRSPEEALGIALHDDDPALNALSAQAISQLGLVDQTEALYAALRSHDPAVRSAAFRALGTMQQRIGTSLPAPA